MSHPRAPVFVDLYERAYGDVVRFAQRRAGTHAEDVAADAFLVAWRRLDELPVDPDDARAWLFGIARNVMLNHRRGAERRDALTVRVAQVGPSLVTDEDADLVAHRVDDPCAIAGAQLGVRLLMNCQCGGKQRPARFGQWRQGCLDETVGVGEKVSGGGDGAVAQGVLDGGHR